MFKLRYARRKRDVIQPDVERDWATWKELDAPWAGTAVGVDLTLTDDQAFRDLLRVIGQVYGMDVRKQKKERYKARFGGELRP